MQIAPAMKRARNKRKAKQDRFDLVAAAVQSIFDVSKFTDEEIISLCLELAVSAAINQETPACVLVTEVQLRYSCLEAGCGDEHCCGDEHA